MKKIINNLCLGALVAGLIGCSGEKYSSPVPLALDTTRPIKESIETNKNGKITRAYTAFDSIRGFQVNLIDVGMNGRLDQVVIAHDETTTSFVGPAAYRSEYYNSMFNELEDLRKTREALIENYSVSKNDLR